MKHSFPRDFIERKKKRERVPDHRGIFRLEKESTMQRWKRTLAFLIAAVVGMSVAAAGISFLCSNYLVDIWWFESLGLGGYYWQRLLYRYVVFASVTLLFFILFFANFWVASRYLGTVAPKQPRSTQSNLKAYQDVLTLFRTGSMWLYTPLSLFVAVFVAMPFFEQWEAFLLFIFASPMNVSDPVFGRDISYYLFSLPVYDLLQRRLLLALFILLCGSGLLYWAERRMLNQQNQKLPHGARWHLVFLFLLLVATEIWALTLQRYELLYTQSHLPLFYGPGFVEMNITLPIVWGCIILLGAAGLSLPPALKNPRYLKIPLAFACMFFLALGLRNATFLTRFVDRYLVKPNEISKERPYIENNIRATLAAYGLSDVETRDFTPDTIPIDLGAPNIREQLRNIPVWDGELLEDVYRQLQQLRTYYNFSDVHVDRYSVDGLYQQVFLSARELSHNQLPAGARNWINEHLVYTHGYGAVMTPACQAGDEPMTWFIRGIPPESTVGFQIEQPGIYFGLEDYNYVVVPNDAGEIDYPKGNTNVAANYSGKDGIPINSLFRKLIFATYFQDRNLFLTTNTNERSRILFRRNVVERIRTLAPFLLLDGSPYLVVTPRGLYWIQDAYTVSDWYPNATPHTLDSGPVNYMRNSVKIVVDAYNGTVNFYRFDSKDPIASAYSEIYPGLFKDKETMPPELASHVRYPKDIFEVQMSIYARYQQQDPEVFYQQEDTWEFAKTFVGNETLPIKPYYVTLDLISPPRFDFLLLVPMSPKGRENLRAVAIAGCDPPHYGKITVYSFPKGQLVFGPSQIHALINQDTKISEQFTLWDQVGSQVDRGRMVILPVGKVILYIQPIYLKSSTQLKIPELKRIIVSQGETVVMEPSIEEAYSRLLERSRKRAP